MPEWATFFCYVSRTQGHVGQQVLASIRVVFFKIILFVPFLIFLQNDCHPDFLMLYLALHEQSMLKKHCFISSSLPSSKNPSGCLSIHDVHSNIILCTFTLRLGVALNSCGPYYLFGTLADSFLLMMGARYRKISILPTPLQKQKRKSSQPC